LGEEYKSFSSSLCNLLHSPVISSLLGPNILHNTMFSNTRNSPYLSECGVDRGRNASVLKVISLQKERALIVG